MNWGNICSNSRQRPGRVAQYTNRPQEIRTLVRPSLQAVACAMRTKIAAGRGGGGTAHAPPQDPRITKKEGMGQIDLAMASGQTRRGQDLTPSPLLSRMSAFSF